VKVRSEEGKKVGTRQAVAGSMDRERKRDLRHFRDLDAYKRAFAAAMEIFELTKSFPSEEKYSMVDQVRRASRLVCTNIAEAWRKRRYVSVFRNKMTDAAQEASETQCWLEFAHACGYISVAVFQRMDAEYENIIGMLASMENKSDKFCY
jgi:four helix bundle protein